MSLAAVRTQRALEVDPPRIDEPAVLIAADRDMVWRAVVDVLGRSFSTSGRALGARLLSCDHVRPRGRFPERGAEVPGFVVDASERPERLRLAGRHRLATYTLTFRLAEGNGQVTVLRAETRATFPGSSGRLYRRIVIGSRMHALLMRSTLLRIKRRAEQC